MSTRSRVLTALVLFTLSAQPSWADVDVAVGNGDKVTGTLSPASELETFRVIVPAGTTLSVSVKGKKAKGAAAAPAPDVRVLDSGDTDVAAGAVQRGTATAKLKKLTLPATGEYRVQVVGDGVTSGDYQISIKWVEPKSFTSAPDLTAGDAAAPFVAGKDCQATLLVKAAKGSAALPRIAKVEQVGGPYTQSPPAPPAGDKKHKVKKLPLPSAAAYQATINDTGGLGGAVSFKVTLKQAKPTKRKIAVTDAQIGKGGGGDSALGVIIGAGGGGFTVDGAEAGEIQGAGVDVPPGAVSGDTVFIIGTAPTVEPPDPNVEGSGPTVFFGPEGQTFDEPVTVTIPVDLTLFGGDFANLQIYQVDGNGAQTLVDPTSYVIDQQNNTVSFPALHFTRFRAFRPAGLVAPPILGDLDDDGYAELLLASPRGGYYSSYVASGVVFVFPGRMGIAQLPITSTLSAPISLMGTTSLGTFGHSVAVGDFNGDRVQDLAVGAPTASSYSGAVELFLGSKGTIPAGPADDVFDLGVPGAGAGEAVAAGDVNDDGIVDLLVGAPGAANSGGAVAIVYGGAVPGQSSDSTITGTRAEGSFASRVAAGDVNGDGKDDIITSASTDGDGKVFVFLGPIGPGTALTNTAAGVQLDGGPTDFGIGHSLAVGDFDGNGRVDVAVGVPGGGGPGIPQLLSPGVVYLYLDVVGGGSGDAELKADALFHGDADNARFGTDVVLADFNGDGLSDLAVGAPGRPATGPFRGAVHVFFGNASPAPRTSSAGAGLTIEGEADDDAFGYLGLPLDVNGDRRPDLHAFAPGKVAGGTESGRFYLFPGGAAFPSGTVRAGTAPLKIDGRPGEFLNQPSRFGVPGTQR